MKKEEINIFKALGLFIQAMRLFVSTELKKKHGIAWERKYFECIMPVQKDSWGKSIQEGINPINLIDYGNLNSFAIATRKNFFYTYFGRKSNNLPTIFNELAEVRNSTAHYLPLDLDKVEKAYLHMIEIAKNLEMVELEIKLRSLKRESFEKVKMTIEKPKSIKNRIVINPNTKQRPIKRRVINLIFNTIGVNIDSSNVNLSTINANGIYSVEPNLKRKNNDWHLLLINTNKRVIYVFNIPSNDYIYTHLYQRDDKDVYRLIFKIDDLSFTDNLSDQKFDKYLEGECKYDNESLLFNI